jgi:hypothetical protein
MPQQPMSEQVPGQAPPPDMNQAVADFVKYVQLMRGAKGGQAAPGGAPGSTLSPGIQGGPPPQMSGGPPGAAPAPGTVPPSFSTGAQAPIPTPGGPQPSAGARMGTSFPNPVAAQGAMVSSAIDSIAGAIHTAKEDKRQSEVTKAQNTLNMFQNALAQGDMQVANLLATDPKIVSSWEKYLKMQFPREPKASAFGPAPAPGSKADKNSVLGNVNEPGGLAVSQDVNAQAMNQAKLASEQALAQQRQASAGKDAADTDKAYIESHADVLKAQAAVSEAEANRAAAKVRLDESEAKLKAQPLENDKLRSEAERNRADAYKAYKEGDKAVKEAGASKNLASFKAASDRIKDVRNDAEKTLARLQTAQNTTRSGIDKTFGLAAEETPEMRAAGAHIVALSRFNNAFNQRQQDIVDGKIDAGDAQTQARRSAGLDSNYAMWSGMPGKTQKGTAIPPTPPKGIENGTVVKDSDGTPLAVAQDGKWVAP